MGNFKVMEERCDQCLYGPNKIVSNKRRSQIIREIERKDCHFICHKATIAGQDICCRGDWDQRRGGKLGRFAEWLGVVKFLSFSPQDRQEAK